MRLEGAPTEKSDVVELGALVETDVINSQIGDTSQNIHIGDKTVIGLPEEAPIYPELKKQSAGDTFSFRDTDYKILAMRQCKFFYF